MNRIGELVGGSPRHLLAIAIAIGLASAQLAAAGPLLVCLTLLLALAALACGLRPHLVLFACALFVLAGAAGQLRLQAIDSDPLAAIGERGGIELTGYLVEHPRLNDRGSSLRLRVEAPNAAGERQTIELRSYQPPPPGITIGDQVVASGRLQSVAESARTPEAQSYARYLLRSGVRRRLIATRVARTGLQRGGMLGFIDAIRRRSERTLASGLATEPAALLRGMVLGGDSGIPEPTTDDFRVVGLTHILAVSGQNILLLVILVQAIAMAIGFGRGPRLWIPVLLICIYVPLCGAQASVVRAGAMGLAGLAAIIASRSSSRVYALVLAAIVVLAWNPRATADIGAQLSFAAVLGIMAFTRPIASRITGVPHWAAEAFAATAGATLATAPLMAYHFGTLSIVSLAANVAAEPLIGPIVWLGSLAAAVGQLSTPLGSLLNAPNGFLLGSLIELAHVGADVPGAQITFRSFGAIALIASALPVVIAGLVANGWVPSGVKAAASETRRRLGAVVPRSSRPLVAVVFATPVLCLTALLAAPSPPLKPPRPSIIFLDVGQGDATLVLGADGCNALIDGGPPGQDLPARLRAFGVERLDLVIATHPQLDHDGGIGEIASSGRPQIKQFFDGGGNTSDPRFNALRSRLTTAHVISAPAVAGRDWRCGDVEVEMLGPAPQPPEAPPPADPNTRAAVTFVTAGAIRMLAAGDAESPQLLPLALPVVDVLKVSHHGSADSGLGQVLTRIDPKLSVIEVGKGNRYGHPTAETLATLAASGTEVKRTDQDGNVLVMANPAARSELAVTADFGKGR